MKSGDIVRLIPRNVKTTRPSQKLGYKKMGASKIIKKVGTRSYKLVLPASMTIHNTFQISLIHTTKTIDFPHKFTRLLRLLRWTENLNTNSRKSWTPAYTITNSNTKPSGQVTLLNTIRPGTQQKTSKIPALPQNNPTPGTPGN